MKDSVSLGWMVGTVKSECNKKERKEYGYNYNVNFHKENYVLPCTLSMESYGYDEEWVILKSVQPPKIATDFDNGCHQPYKVGEKVKCKFKGVDGEDVFHNGIVKRLFQQEGPKKIGNTLSSSLMKQFLSIMMIWKR